MTTKDIKREAALAQAQTENKVPAFVIEPGYEEQALPLSAPQFLVLVALHEALQLTRPFEVLPPVEGNPNITASIAGDRDRVLIEVDDWGFLDRVAVHYSLGAYSGWVDIDGSDESSLFDRIKQVVNDTRLSIPKK